MCVAEGTWKMCVLMKGRTQLGSQQAVKEGRSEDRRGRCVEQTESRGRGSVALRRRVAGGLTPAGLCSWELPGKSAWDNSRVSSPNVADFDSQTVCWFRAAFQEDLLRTGSAMGAWEAGLGVLAPPRPSPPGDPRHRQRSSQSL